MLEIGDNFDKRAIFCITFCFFPFIFWPHIPAVVISHFEIICSNDAFSCVPEAFFTLTYLITLTSPSG